MPSSRAMAKHLGISRRTVIDVYETLLADGLICTRQGRGTFVVDQDRLPATAQSEPARRAVSLSERGRHLLASSSDWSPSWAERVLQPGIPALDLFPYEQWRRSLSKSVAAAGPKAHWSSNPCGSATLRGMIAAHIGPSRDVACTADQIVLFSSQRLALHVLFALLLDPGSPVLVEDPCLPELLAVARAQGQIPVPISVSEEGADITRIDPAYRAARLAVVTPAHQYPTGVTMQGTQRSDLLDWANSQDSYILEDDYDGEFWLSDNRVGALYGQATNDRVIYFNSFSKTMFPALRLSYLVLPEALVAPVCALKGLLEPQVSSMAELALTEFIASGAYTKHLRAMRQVYRERHKAMQFALEQRLGARVRIASGQCGLHLCANLEPRLVDTEITAAMAARGYGCKALSGYYANPPDTNHNGLVIGYAGWDVPILNRSIEVLGTLCR